MGNLSIWSFSIQLCFLSDRSWNWQSERSCKHPGKGKHIQLSPNTNKHIGRICLSKLKENGGITLSRDILLTSLIISGCPNWRTAPLSLHYDQDQGYSTEKVPVIHTIIISPTFKIGTKAIAGAVTSWLRRTHRETCSKATTNCRSSALSQTNY